MINHLEYLESQLRTFMSGNGLGYANADIRRHLIALNKKAAWSTTERDLLLEISDLWRRVEFYLIAKNIERDK